jgi:hypothetical protein
MNLNGWSYSAKLAALVVTNSSKGDLKRSTMSMVITVLKLCRSNQLSHWGCQATANKNGNAYIA